jgi:hypothetical protein
MGAAYFATLAHLSFSAVEPWSRRDQYLQQARGGQGAPRPGAGNLCGALKWGQPRASFPAVEANLAQGSPEHVLRVRVEAVRSEEIVGAVAGLLFADTRCDAPSIVAPPGERRARGCNREDLHVCIGSSRRLGRPFRGLLELAQPNVGGGPAA